eukprot:gnl/Hemi2/2707_TR949_c0_g4_i1.p1 gnl/Hemi2/2707_TR949_c0_g4~~gnl/Hemi2/2707_TR949_c0_g4_i1.p1  ORF type:complete len:157 (-),score=54.14 gnl/Hemi2/2707_TR949_c0_g4_i1:59-529(-)
MAIGCLAKLFWQLLTWQTGLMGALLIINPEFAVEVFAGKSFGGAGFSLPLDPVLHNAVVGFGCFLLVLSAMFCSSPMTPANGRSAGLALLINAGVHAYLIMTKADLPLSLVGKGLAGFCGVAGLAMLAAGCCGGSCASSCSSSSSACSSGSSKKEK